MQKKKLKGSKNFPISKIANNIIDKKNDVELSKFINVFPLFQKPSIYIPAERIIISLLSQSIYSLIKNKINLPELLLDFAANYEQARNEIKEYKIKFLKANYSYKNGKEILEINKQETLIAEAASGFQTLIPMLLVCEFFLKDKLSQTYIIEEPELNLFPTAQKDLIYHLINIINNSYSKEQNTSHDLVMTTHSPYILASLNNLLLAGKIKEEQPIKFTKAKKIVNGDYYISKNDLNVYALKNGKAKSIISKETGLIAENELDHVSEEINYEFNALKNLYFESAN
ncbi:MAG: ATP-binding protein [Bacteroidetes bacterium]|nr:ATP-binding protein [Bacteroidota bacterium]